MRALKQHQWQRQQLWFSSFTLFFPSCIQKMLPGFRAWQLEVAHGVVDHDVHRSHVLTKRYVVRTRICHIYLEVNMSWRIATNAQGVCSELTTRRPSTPPLRKSSSLPAIHKYDTLRNEMKQVAKLFPAPREVNAREQSTESSAKMHEHEPS